MRKLYCDSVSKSFDGLDALNNISIQFPSSGIVALIGPNGAGKTTLLNVLTGFLQPETGKSFLGDHELTGLAPHSVARLGIARTFQDLRLITQVSVCSNVMLSFPDQRGEKLFASLFSLSLAQEEERIRREAERLLNFVGLANKSEEPAGELSYGQQKLLTLACCLATNANILMLDEPVAGVYPETAAHILDRLQRISEDGKLIIFIEHDIEAVRSIADLVIVMAHGEIIDQGPPQEILDSQEIIEVYLA